MKISRMVIALVFLLLASVDVAGAQSANREATGSAATIQQSYAGVVDRVAPAVVTIRSARRVRAAQQFPFQDEPFFRNLFGNRQPQQRNDRGYLEQALGSGVIVSADGFIITNHHVVDGADEIKVELNDRRTFNAKLVGSDAPSDLAVLKIEATRLPVLSLGDSDKVRVGDICLAVGNPLGIGETVTSGIISAKGRATGLSDGSFEDFLQTDAAINRGNSGGALVNTRGELIGINSQILSPSGGSIGIGFAIPSNMARNVMDQLRSGGKVHRGKLGVTIQPITPDLATSMNLKTTRGVLVNSVEPNSPAERAGIRAGDVIAAVNGTPVDDTNTLRNRIASTAPGTEVRVSVLREGKEQQMEVRLQELATEATADANGGAPSPGGSDRRQFGLRVEPLRPEVAADLGLKRTAKGAVVTDIDPAGPAAEAGIQADDVILEVNHQPVSSGAEITAAAGKSGSRPALLLVSRGGRNIFIAVKPAAPNK